MKSTQTECNIIIADDHAMVREGLRGLFQKDPTIRIVSEAADGGQLLRLLETKPCDIVIMDISMPEKNGLETIQEIAEKYPEIRVLVLTMHTDIRYFRKATSRKNVYGYILKDEAFDRLIDAVRKVRSGEKAYSSKIQQMMLEDYHSIRDGRKAVEDLTRREKEVIRLAVAGHINKEVANKLFISVRTVESHRANIMEKLKLDNFAELVKFAVANGLTDDVEE